MLARLRVIVLVASQLRWWLRYGRRYSLSALKSRVCSTAQGPNNTPSQALLMARDTRKSIGSTPYEPRAMIRTLSSDLSRCQLCTSKHLTAGTHTAKAVRDDLGTCADYGPT